MQNTNKVLIAIVVHDNLASLGLKSILAGHTEFNIIIEARSGQDFFQQLSRSLQLPHIVVLDNAMYLMNGEEILIKLKKLFPRIKVLSLSVYCDKDNISKMIRAGTNGYLARSHGFLIIEALYSIHNSGYYYSAIAGKALFDKLQKQKPQPPITKRKKQILEMLCRGFSNEDIATSLAITTEAVIGHKKEMFLKFDLHSKEQLIYYAITTEIITIPPPSSK